MAITETRVVQVPNDPRVINASNEAWRRWGWTVLGVQITNSQDSRLSGASMLSSSYDGVTTGMGSIEVETTVINYATITYQRDTGMANYGRIAELQQEYESIEVRVKNQLRQRIEQVKAMEREFQDKPWSSGEKMLHMFGGFIGGSLFTAMKVAKRKQQAWDEKNRQYGGYEKRVAMYEKLKAELKEDMESMIENESNRIIRERNQLLSV